MSSDRSGAPLTPLLAGASAYCAMAACGSVARQALGEASGGETLLWVAGAAALAALLLLRRSPAPRPAEPADAAPLPAPRLGRLATFLLGLVVLFFAFARLDAIPHFRGDESLEIQFPANLVRHGQFAFPVGETLAPELWLCTTGPAVLLPAAGMFAWLGVSVGAARLVSGFYLMVAGLAAWRLARRGDAGAGAAAIALLLFLSSPEIVNTARMLLGDYASLAFLLLGLHEWLAALEAPDPRGRRLRSARAGLLLGLMLLAKPVFALTAFGFLAYLLADRAGERRVGWVHVALPGAIVLALVLPWEVWRIQHGTAVLLHGQVPGFPSSYLRVELAGLPAKLREALQRPELWLAPLGLLWSLGRDAASRRQAQLLGYVAAILLGWWLTFVIVLDRYLIAPQLLAGLLAASFLARALERLGTARDPLERLLAAGVSVVLVALPALRVASNVEKVLRAPGGEWEEQRFARALLEHLPAGAEIQVASPPIGYLFFDPRPYRVVPAERALELREGSLYLVTGAVRLPGEGLETVVEVPPYRLLRRVKPGLETER